MAPRLKRALSARNAAGLYFRYVKRPTLRAAAQRSYYSGTLTEFCAADRNEIFARMARRNDFDLTGTQRDAWLEEAEILQRALARHTGALYLEFTIPRMGRRIDAVVIIGPVIFVLEFKVGEQTFPPRTWIRSSTTLWTCTTSTKAATMHTSHPYLICTRAAAIGNAFLTRVPRIACSRCRDDERRRFGGDDRANSAPRAAPDIRIDQWEESGYKPTPTIIEATLALYRGHSVTEISRSDAGATNLSKTAGTVASIIAATKARSQKAICFVTGVPGSGQDTGRS